MAMLFNRDRSVISRHVSNILKNNGLDPNRVCAKNAHTGPDGKIYIVDYFNLEIIIAIATKVKSNRGTLIKEFLSEYLDNLGNTSNNIIIYNNGNLNLAVTISPEEETVWLNVNQIASLFDVSTDNIYSHIQNIINDGEMSGSVAEDSSVTQAFCKKIATIASDGKTYFINYYNLDMILSIGYRVKSAVAANFRRWANSVLKRYLLKGYAIDSNRVVVSNENYQRLENDVADSDMLPPLIEVGASCSMTLMSQA